MLWSAVAERFADPSLLLRVQAMARAEVQTEGWWKAELIYLFECLQKSGQIAAWDRECSAGTGRTKVDFEIHEPDMRFVIEVKTAFCGMQKGVAWKLAGYVMGPNSGFIMTDILKLAAIKRANRRHQCFELVFAYPGPQTLEWQALVRAISVKAPDVDICLFHLDEIGQGALSIGWLRVDQAPAKGQSSYN